MATTLAAACAALATLAAVEIASGARADAAARFEAAATAAEPIKEERQQNFSLPALSSYAEVMQRPLFNGTRRPALAADQSGAAWSSFVLKGVILSPITHEALVLHSKPAALVSLHEGEMLDGWVAESILPDRVVFRKGIEQQELKLAVAQVTQMPAERAATSAEPPPSRPQPPSL
jgi:type II secretory pathway component PulC